jgi:hypothetical protein
VIFAGRKRPALAHGQSYGLSQREAVKAHAEVVEMRVALPAKASDGPQLVVLPGHIARVDQKPTAGLRHPVPELGLAHTPDATRPT